MTATVLALLIVGGALAGVAFDAVQAWLTGKAPLWVLRSDAAYAAWRERNQP